MPILDGLVAILLVVCIAYCIQLNQKILALHRNKNDFAKGIKYFDNAVLRAESSLADMRNIATLVTNLQQTVTTATTLQNDLSFMVDHASRLADKLEISIADSRSLLSSTPPAPTLPSYGHPEGKTITTLSALRHARNTPANDTDNSRTQALQSLLERISMTKDAYNKLDVKPQTSPLSSSQTATSGKNFLKSLRSLQREDAF